LVFTNGTALPMRSEPRLDAWANFVLSLIEGRPANVVQLRAAQP
jgi:hypothetical protein